jgi:hypothetical protein
MNSKKSSSTTGSRRRMPRSEARKIYSMYESGVTIDVIQSLTGRARSTIYRTISIERTRRGTQAAVPVPTPSSIVVPKQEDKPQPYIPMFSEAVPDQEQIPTPTFLQRCAISFCRFLGVTDGMYGKH